MSRRTTSPTRLPLLGAALLATAGILAALGQPQDPRRGELELPANRFQEDEPELGERPFHIYDSAIVRALVDEAEEHFSSERWTEGLSVLQTLIEDHAAEVLGATSPGRGQRASERPVHTGAAKWATARLFGLPEDVRERYRQRHQKDARAALARALNEQDVGALVEVARRWPLCSTARRAWFALGDLELERGSSTVASGAWSRAVAHALGRADVPRGDDAWPTLLRDLNAAAEAETSLAAVLAGAFERDARLAARRARETAEGGATAARSAIAGPFDVGQPVRPEEDAWPAPVPLPEGPFGPGDGRDRLFAAREGSTVFVSTTRDVLAVGAWTGDVLWRSPADVFGPHLPSWRDFLDEQSGRQRKVSEMVDEHQSLFAPAVGHGVVVAPLQLPVELDMRHDYNDLEIIRVHPERRLFAFDAATGRKLWGHLPPAGWTGDGGAFHERMSVVGPPTIVGDRVLAPLARMDGRIDFHVGCFDLDTGAVLWHTPLISGQRELNMFGRPLKEFSSAPIVVEGDRAIVLTQLGTLACLDLYTGAPEWETLYDQIPIRPGWHYQASDLPTVWHNGPPFVADGAVVAAPEDSRYLIGVDLDTGAQIWSLSHAELALAVGPESHAIRRLIGVLDNRIYLAGKRIACFQASNGLRRAAPERLAWKYPDKSTRVGGGLGTWPVLTSNRVYMPGIGGQGRLTILDARSGRQMEEAFAITSEGIGNLLVSEDALFTLNPYRLMGWFEWKTMVRRARDAMRAQPDLPGPVRDLALVLMQAGRSARLKAATTADLAEANRYLKQAREELEAQIERPGFAILQAPLYRVLREQATAARMAADSRAATQALTDALELAPMELDRAETLLELQEVQRTTNAVERLATLDLLFTEFPALRFWCVVERGPGVGAWRGRLIPEETLLGDQGPASRKFMTVDLFVRVERSEARRRSSDDADIEAEFADLFAVLAEHADEPLFDGTAGAWATERIGENLRADRRAGFGRYETEAAAALEAAVAAGDEPGLRRVAARWPHTLAATRANDARLELAMALGDATIVVDIVLGELASGWNPAEADPRSLQSLTRLADALGRAGNPELRAGLVRRLARWHPTTEVALLDEAPRRLADWAGTWKLDPLSPPPAATFGAGPLLDRTWGERYTPGPRVPPADEGGAWVQLVEGKSSLRGFGMDDPLATNPWYEETSGPASRASARPRTAVSRGRVHLASGAGVRTVRAADGANLWTWDPGLAGQTAAVFADGGVVLAVVRPNETNPFLVTALDAELGVELWRLEFDGMYYRPNPVLGDGACVVLPISDGKAQVFDIYTGSRLSSFAVDGIDLRTSLGAWIEAERIVLPYFLGRHATNQVLAHDLESGERVWRLAMARQGAEADLIQVLRHDGRTWAVRVLRGEGDGERVEVRSLDVDRGRFGPSPLASLPGDAKLVGMYASTTIELSEPWVFCRARDRMQLIAVNLERGRAWVAPLEEGDSTARPSDMATPVVGRDHVALIMGRRTQRSSECDLELRLLDLTNGRVTFRQVIQEASYLLGDLVSLGGALLVCGPKRAELWK